MVRNKIIYRIKILVTEDAELVKSEFHRGKIRFL